MHGSLKEYLRDRQREQGNTNDVKGVQLTNNLYHLYQTQVDLHMPGNVLVMSVSWTTPMRGVSGCSLAGKTTRDVAVCHRNEDILEQFSIYFLLSVNPCTSLSFHFSHSDTNTYVQMNE